MLSKSISSKEKIRLLINFNVGKIEDGRKRLVLTMRIRILTNLENDREVTEITETMKQYKKLAVYKRLFANL